MIAPTPTAPMGAASPSCPTTPVSTTPRMGTVAFESTMGKAIRATRPCVIGRAGSAILPRHQEMALRLREGAVAIVLPCLDMDRAIAPARPGNAGARIRVTRQARAQVIDGEVDGPGQSRDRPVRHRVGIDLTAFDPGPKRCPTQPDDRRRLKKSRRRAAV